jgi:hypothetical protein
MIRILHKRPGMVNEPKVMEIEDTLSAMQSMVAPEHGEGSYHMIELVRIGALQEQGIDLYVNEEGKFNGCLPNFEIYGGRDLVMGPAFFVSSNDEGETVGLTDAQLKFAQGWLEGQPQAIGGPF